MRLQEIEQEVGREVYSLLLEYGYAPYRNKKLAYVGANKTDFTIWIELHASRKWNDVSFDPVVWMSWNKFSRLFYELTLAYEDLPPTRNKKFLGRSFSQIVGEKPEASSRMLYLVDEGGAGPVARAIAEIYKSSIHSWVEKWLRFDTALATLEADEELGGSWRPIAFFSLLDQVRGRDVACEWATTAVLDEDTEFQRIQIEFLQYRFCRS